MRKFKLALLCVVFIIVITGALKALFTNLTVVQSEFDDKAEWSVLQAAYQIHKTKKADNCIPITYLYRDSKAVGFWSPQGWVWILMPSNAGSEIKVLPKGVKFFLPKFSPEVGVPEIRDSRVIDYIRENSVSGCF